MHRIIVIGKVKEGWINAGIQEYLKRLKPLAKVEIIELKDQGKEKEAEKLCHHLSPTTYLLAEEGKMISSVEFSDLLKKEVCTFIIGSHEGISDDLKKKGKLLSLSRMTFTHEMARLLLIEQIYRAMMIQKGRKYHR